MTSAYACGCQPEPPCETCGRCGEHCDCLPARCCVEANRAEMLAMLSPAEAAEAIAAFAETDAEHPGARRRPCHWPGGHVVAGSLP